MKKIIVVGCGVSGMAATMYAIKNGYNVDIYETFNHIGGRCFSVFRKNDFINAYNKSNINLAEDLFTVDNGQHLISGSYKYFFELLDWLGTSHLIVSKKKLEINFIDTNSGKQYLLNFSDYLKLFTTKYISIKDKWKVFCFFKYVLRNENELADYSVLEVCKKNKITDSIVERLISPMVISLMNSPIEVAPVSIFIATIKTILSAGKQGLILTYCEKTFAELFLPFTDKIKKTGDNKLYLNSKVKDFFIEDGICKGIILPDGTIKNADIVISTITPKDYKSISGHTHIKENFPTSAILSAYFWTNEKLDLKYEYNAIIGGNIDWIFDMNTEKNDESNIYQYRITVSNFTKFNENISMNTEEMIKIELKKIFKKEINIYSIYTIFQPNATSLITNKNYKLRPSAISHINNLYLTGDWTDTKLPVCIESAAVSGYLSVKKICNI